MKRSEGASERELACGDGGERSRGVRNTQESAESAGLGGSCSTSVVVGDVSIAFSGASLPGSNCAGPYGACRLLFVNH